MYSKIASAIYNDVVSGLRGYNSNLSMSLEQLEDEIVDERLTILKEYALKGIPPKSDLYMSINCIKTDCESLERCGCSNNIPFISNPKLIPHFEIPQIVNEYTDSSIEYMGSTDRQNNFLIYTSHNSLKSHKYRKRGKDKPYVFIDTTPNSNNMYDCFIFNAPFIKQISVVAIFKDLRQLQEMGCCDTLEVNNMSFVDNEVRKRLTQKKLMYYRQYIAPLQNNDQTPE